MQVERRSVGAGDVVVVVLDPGEEAIERLQHVAQGAGIEGAGFTAVGAFERATVGWFDLDRRDYDRIPVDEQVEVLSLAGDIGRRDGQPMVHAHVVLGCRDGRTVGGHLLDGHVRPTLEVIIRETPTALQRVHDADTGLALIDLQR